MQQRVLENLDPRVLGRRLQNARQARAMTQQDVADQLNAARTTITAIEKGERRVQPEELLRLSELYGRSIGYLVREREPAESFGVQFRAFLKDEETAATASELEQAVNDFQDISEDYVTLESLNGIESLGQYTVEFQIGRSRPELAAQEAAESERNRLGLGDGPIVYLREVLENDVGLRIFYIRMPSRVAGMFAFSDDLGGCIAVNVRHPEERRRWSMAHEYGHFLSGRYQAEVSSTGQTGRKPTLERFADAFARFFLMPSAGLRRRFNQVLRASEGRITVGELVRLAHHYVVSVQAMMLRLEEMRLITAGTWQQLDEQKFKPREAQAELGLEPPQQEGDMLPLRYKLLAVRAFEDEKITEGQLARYLRTDRVSARDEVAELKRSLHTDDLGGTQSVTLDLSSQVAMSA